jgi:uncharacterized membrane protein YukC
MAFTGSPRMEAAATAARCFLGRDYDQLIEAWYNSEHLQLESPEALGT